MKKVLIFSDRWESNTGYARQGRELATGLADKGYEVFYVSSNFGLQATDIQAKPIPDKNITLLPLAGDEGSDFYLIKLISYLNYHRPDIFLVIGDPVLRVQLQNLHKINFLPEIKKLFYAYIDSDIMPNTSAEILKKMDKIIPASKFAKMQIELEDFKCESVLNPPVKPERFKPLSAEEKEKAREKWKFGQNDFIVFNYMRIFKRKNPFQLLEAAIKIGLKHPEVKFFFQWVEYQKYPQLDVIDYLDRVIPIRLNLGKDFKWEDIIFLNNKPLTNEEVAEAMGMSDMTISVSGGEGFNFMIPETMFCEVPMMIADNTTAREVTCGNGFAHFIPAPHPVDAGYGCWHYIPDSDIIFDEFEQFYKSGEYDFIKNNIKNYKSMVELDEKKWVETWVNLIEK